MTKFAIDSLGVHLIHAPLTPVAQCRNVDQGRRIIIILFKERGTYSKLNTDPYFTLLVISHRHGSDSHASLLFDASIQDCASSEGASDRESGYTEAVCIVPRSL